MAIPSIRPYSMPRPDHLPDSRVSWTLDPRRAVLLVHDMQEYFLDFYDADASPVPELIANIAVLREGCAAAGVPIAYTAQPARQTAAERGLLQDMWGPGLTAQPTRDKIADAIAPRSGDLVIAKRRYSAFERTDLLALMRGWGRDQLIVCGVYGRIGCLVTACDAFMNDIQPFCVGDAMADFSWDDHLAALDYAASVCAKVISTGAVVGAVAAVGGAVAAVAAAGRANAASATATAEARAGTGPRRRAWTIDRAREDVAQILDLAADQIPDGDNLLDLGLDSIRLMTVVERWRREGVELSFVDLAERPTLAQWWDMMSAELRRDGASPNAARGTGECHV